MALTDNLVAYYAFDGDTLDSSGNGNDATPHGSPLYPAGILNEGFDNNGNNGNYAGRAGLPGTASWSISLWLKRTSGLGGGNSPVISNNSLLAGIYVHSDERIKFYTWAGTDCFAATGTAPLDTWVHVVLTYNGTRLQWYINGVADGTNTVSQFTLSGFDPYTILDSFAGNNGTYGAWKGILDELAIWTTREIDSTEVTQLYNGGAGFNPFASDPLTVTDIDPATGYTPGGAAVTITGTGFVDGATVDLGGVPATDVEFVSGTELTAVTPAAGAPATVDVVVTNPDTTTATLTDGFEYLAVPTPTVVSLDVVSGPVGGGTDVMITGTGFIDGAVASFGGVDALETNFINSTHLSVLTPAHAAGPADVTVTNPSGPAGTKLEAFRFADVVSALAAQVTDLLPPGKIWRLDVMSTLRRLLFAVGDEFARVSQRVDDLINEADPRTATETLAEWERMLALPDEQVPTIPATTAGRRLAITQKFIARGGQSEDFFRQLITACGWDGAGADIQTFQARVLRAGFRVNDRVWGDKFAYALLILANTAATGALTADQFKAVLRKALHSHIVLITEDF